MKKKVYVALLSLCCPIILNTQQVFAEEASTNDSTVSSETVIPEVTPDLPVAPAQEQVETPAAEPAVSEEPVVEVPAAETPAETPAAPTETPAAEAPAAEAPVKEQAPAETTAGDTYAASGDVLVNFVDEEGNPVVGAPAVTLGGAVGDTYSYDPVTISGYTYTGTTLTGTLTADLQVVDAVYKKDATDPTKTVDITVTFVSTKGAVIQRVPLSGKEGDKVGVSIPNNVLVVDTPANSGFSMELTPAGPALIGVLTAASIDFTVVVEENNASGDVQINFVDTEGNPVVGAPAVTLGGQVGDAYNYDPVAIPGYTYVGSTLTGTLTADLQVVDAVYEKDPVDPAKDVSIDVTFFDATTGTIYGRTTLAGKEGDKVDVAIPSGYVVTDTPVNSGFSMEVHGGVSVLTGMLTASSIDFTVTMEKFNPSGDVQINFVDEEGNPVVGAPDVTLGGEIGDAYSYDPVAIPGYTYIGGTLSGTLTDTLQVVDAVYARAEATVTFTYLDEAGNAMPHASDSFTGKYGEVYDVTPPVFAGYELVSVNGAAFTTAELPLEVAIGEEDQNYVLVYRNTTVVDPITPDQPIQANPVVKPVAKAQPKLKPTGKGTLPKTGETENSIMASVAGALVIAQAAYVLKKKNEENEFGI